MLLGSERPSPLPSSLQFAQVDGMNCIGPTARSWVVSPSNSPPSVSLIMAKPLPLRAGPRMGLTVVPFSSTLPPRAWPDSTLPIAASSCHGRLQPGLDSLSAASAFLYAARTLAGMPASALVLLPGDPGRSVEEPGLSGLVRGGRSVWCEEPPSMGVSGDDGAPLARSRSRWSPSPCSWAANPGACEAVRGGIAAAGTAVLGAPLDSLVSLEGP